MSSWKRLLVFSWESSYWRMKASAVLLLVALYMGAGRGAQEGDCGRAGALRCDADGRHLSACTKGGALRRVLDCGASHAACVNGRCVGGASARAEECSTPGEWSCSSDCAYKTICTLNNVWTEISPCPIGYICDCGECVDSATKTCRYNDRPICAQGSVPHFFPDVNDCSVVYGCVAEGEPAVPQATCTSDPNIYYQPCTGQCDSTSTICDRYKKCSGNEGLDAAVPGNPTLHYICANGTMFLMKCVSPTSMYDPLVGECFEVGLQYCPNVRLDINSFSKIDRFDECSADGSSSTDGSTTTTDDTTTTTDDTTTTTDDTTTTTTTDGSTTTSGPCIVGSKWADADNECKFFYCYPPGDPIHMTCPPNSKYDATAASCVAASGLCLR